MRSFTPQTWGVVSPATNRERRAEEAEKRAIEAEARANMLMEILQGKAA